MKKLLILLLLSISLSAFAGSQLDFTLSDFCYKQPNVQKREGVYYFPNKEVGISATSICVYKDSYGQYESKGNLVNGTLDGKWTLWRENGQIQIEANYKDGTKDGKYTYWWLNGQITVSNMKDNKRDGKSTKWYANGQIKSVENYKDGECISGC